LQRKKRLLPASDYPVAALLGVHVCVTGFAERVKGELEDLVRKHGGKFSLDFFQDTTHLLADPTVRRASAPSGKLEAALQRHLPVVSAQWLYDSIAAKGISPHIDRSIDRPLHPSIHEPLNNPQQI